MAGRPLRSFGTVSHDAPFARGGRAMTGNRRYLRCPKCRRQIESSAKELASFFKTIWPSCCGEKMLLYIDAGPAATTELRVRKSRPPAPAEVAAADDTQPLA